MNKSIVDNTPFKNIQEKSNLNFDYEIINTKFDDSNELKTKLYYFDKKIRNFKIVNYNLFTDYILEDNDDGQGRESEHCKSFYKANFIKRLVSKKKKRLQNEHFDLDMSYITKRVIAMGYPSTGCETIYRNSLSDTLLFFQKYHNSNVKIYNLCIEKERIYNKEVFNDIMVGLFPSKDHNPCPIKLILEFCVDITLFLIKNPDSVAAIHCKAGKGRTGVMICCYLIFSGLCKSTDEALEYYAKRRTFNKKGVTIPSQKRYIQYFETFLITNFGPPYRLMIPLMIKYHLNLHTTNILKNFINDDSYFITPNTFYLNYIKIGPFASEKMLEIKINDFINTKFKYEEVERNSVNENDLFFYIEKYKSQIPIKSDLKMEIIGSGVDFYYWINLWYSSLDLIKVYLEEIQDELERKANPGIEIHPKLKFLPSIKNLKKKLQENKNPPNEDLKHQSIELKEDNFIAVNNEKINKKTHNNHIIKDDDIYFLHNFEPLNVDSKSSPEIKNPEIESLNNIINKLNHNTDLNLIVDVIKTFKSKENFFIKNDLNIFLFSSELDKFDNVKKMMKNFTVQINYTIEEKR